MTHRDDRGRFCPAWWRPRDARGRFVGHREVRRRSFLADLSHGLYQQAWQPTTGVGRTVAATYSVPNWVIDFPSAGDVGRWHDAAASAIQTAIQRQVEMATTDTVGTWINWTTANVQVTPTPTQTQVTAVVGPSPAQQAWDYWQQHPYYVASGTQYPSYVAPVRIAPSFAGPPQPDVRELHRRSYVSRTRFAAQQLRRRVADRRARELLLEMLDDAQRADLERANYFEVISQSGSRYRVAKGYQGNVYLLDADGNPVERLCIHGPSVLPDSDQMLSQKLMLETDEVSFRRIANITRFARGSRVLAA